MTRPGAAALALAVLLGLAVGAGVAMMGRAGGGGNAAEPTETTAEPPPTDTTPPSGFWTAIIASIESRRTDAREQARRVVDDAAAKGQEAFVLDGGAYDGLGDPYLAVCVGRFGDQRTALAQVATLRGLGYKPYARDVGDLTDGGDQSGGDQNGDN
jgi:hypothetical protein